jgi:DNA-binding CsgD family transcriptional regulator
MGRMVKVSGTQGNSPRLAIPKQLRMEQRDYLDVSASADRATFERRLVAFAQNLDFDLASAAVAVDRPGEKPTFEMIGNTPEAFLSASRDPENVRRDPVVKRMKSLYVPFFYDQDLYVQEGAGDLWEEFAPFGYRTGIAVATHLPGGKHFLLGIDRSKPLPTSDSELTRLMADIHLLAVYAQQTAIRVLLQEDAFQTPVTRLTPREREVLQWTAQGKSAWAVGEILKMSESTVLTHLRNVRAKMGVSSKHQAILRAVSLGLITV